MKAKVPVLTDKVVWITGASSGIGEQLSYQFAALGASLILSARSVDGLEAVRRKIQDHDRVQVLPLDLGELELLPGLCEQALGLFGRVDILVNNAGIALKDFVLSTSLETDQRIMAVNYFGPVAMTKAVLPHMLERGAGQIVVMSSLSGKYGGVPRISSYAASKHALHGFFDTLRNELCDAPIDITVLVPGIIRTEITAHAIKGDGTPFGRVETLFREGYPADRAAHKMVQAVLKRKEEVFVGGTERVTLFLYWLSPRFFRWFIRSHPMKKLRALKHFFIRRK